MKRTYREIDIKILQILRNGNMSVNELSQKLKSNWSTINSHLEHLEKIGLVKKTLFRNRLTLYGLAED